MFCHKKWIIMIIALVLLLLPFASCVGGPLFSAPLIVNFSATPNIIAAGSSVTLIWVVTGASSVRIDPNIGNVAMGGSLTVTPSASILYTLTATNSFGTSTATASVTVNQPLPTITSFNISPSIITYGQTANLTWNVTGANSINISPSIGGVAASGNRELSPTATTTYVITAANSSGTSTATATITVNPLPIPPVSNGFRVSPSIINRGGFATIYWDVTGATSIRIDPGIGVVPATGSKTVSPLYTTTYVLTATDADCNCIISDEATLTVIPYLGPPYYGTPQFPYNQPPFYSPPEVITFTAQPPIITVGQATTIQWNVAGATLITINNGIGAVNSVGSISLIPTETTQYILTAANSYGSINATTMIVVHPSTETLAPTINYFSASPSAIALGHSTTLSWSVSGATSISINQGIGAVSETGNRVVSPTNTTAYVITASNSAGVVQHTVTITVY